MQPPRTETYADPATDIIVALLDGIGIPVGSATLTVRCFLPGIRLDRGKLLVDRDRLEHPGDLLHEAGHVAVMTPDVRASRSAGVGKNMGDEIAAIAWSWAALKHLKLAPEIVFHAKGYRGASDWHIQTFSGGACPGLPLLQWMGLTFDTKRAAERGIRPFPHMVRWLREADAPQD